MTIVEKVLEETILARWQPARKFYFNPEDIIECYPRLTEQAKRLADIILGSPPNPTAQGKHCPDR